MQFETRNESGKTVIVNNIIRDYDIAVSEQPEEIKSTSYGSVLSGFGIYNGSYGMLTNVSRYTKGKIIVTSMGGENKDRLIQL